MPVTEINLPPLRHPFQGFVEFAPTFQPRPGLRHVLFDFDGTLSIIRHAWPAVMSTMFLEFLPALPEETEDARLALIMDDMMRLNGKQTIFQMIQLADRIRDRGAEPREPLWYKHEFLHRLDLQISENVEGLRTGRIAPDTLLVHGARQLLEHLVVRGLTLHLASGTDEPYLKREAELLGISPYFEGRIFGALDDYRSFSKKMVIERILSEHCITGAELLSFGDGYVEISNTKEVGGLAVAVASDEAHNGSGRIDEWKRGRLVAVAADVVIPDYRDAVPLLETLTTP